MSTNVNGNEVLMSTDIRNVPLFKTLEMSPFVVSCIFNFPVVVEAVRKVGIRGVCGFPSAVGKSVLWTFPRSGFSTAFRRRASSCCSRLHDKLLLPRAYRAIEGPEELARASARFSKSLARRRCGRTRRRCARPPSGAVGRQSPSYRRAT